MVQWSHSEGLAESMPTLALENTNVSDGCRMVFALGAVQACGHAAGDIAMALADQWSSLCPSLWSGLASATDIALRESSSLTDAVAAADAWGEETGDHSDRSHSPPRQSSAVQVG